jgi:RNA polymerase sigma-70 factor (ECF subfamily)
MEDASLVNAARGGDAKAFRALVERHYDRIYRLAYRMLRRQADAEDVAQDVCVALARALAGFRGESAFSTWLYRVTLNACRDFARRQAAIEALNRSYGEASAHAAADAAEDQRRSGWLAETLASLDPGLRETAVLVLAEELSHAEAAAILGVKEKTVSWRMHELRKKLKAQADSYHDG